MERIVLRHLSGSKASQVEEFAVNDIQELTLGRDPSMTIKYDPQQDDLVSRTHAKITRDPANPNHYQITDLNSSNGTFVNKQRISGAVSINPGDVVQLGAGGPEFQFDLDPRPEGVDKATRVQSAPSAPQTREGSVPTPIPSTQSQAPMTGSTPKQTIGKQTVERMIADTKKESRTGMFLGIVIVLIIVGALAGGGIYLMGKSKKEAEGKLAANEKKMAEMQAAQGMTVEQIAENNKSTVVYIECAWSLVHTPTGKQVYHVYIPNRDNSGRPLINNNYNAVQLYVQMPDGSIEPMLTLESNAPNQPIAGTHSGSGFVVSSDGFILTNRHVAAAWRAFYGFPQEASIGILIGQNGKPVADANGGMQLVQAPAWVPGLSKQAPKGVTGFAQLEGRNDLLNVMFTGNSTRTTAKVSRVSDRADVALIKVDVPESLTKVELFDNHDNAKPGQSVVVMGYPGISKKVYGVKKSVSLGIVDPEVTVIPQPTVTPGNIQLIIRGNENPGKDKIQLYSEAGDVYQLSINTTGHGNSGGPVFDNQNRVIAIFTYGWGDETTKVSGAVPIKFGMELMTTQPDAK